MPSLTSDPRDVTVLPADTFQPVNWIGISEVIFHQVEKTKKKKKNKQKTTRQQRKNKTNKRQRKTENPFQPVNWVGITQFIFHQVLEHI